MGAPTLDQIIERIASAPSAHIGAIMAELVVEGASPAHLLSAANGLAYAAILSAFKRCPREGQKVIAESQLRDLNKSVMRWFENEGHA
ncbi:MAG: hypothetical protein CTY36_10490 [Methylocystis sp.]|nr:MAG: hypothetical protein CTY36_10490 [Methylocystis sp.]